LGHTRVPCTLGKPYDTLPEPLAVPCGKDEKITQMSEVQLQESDSE
jgi:hypothetical protein